MAAAYLMVNSTGQSNISGCIFCIHVTSAGSYAGVLGKFLLVYTVTQIN